VRVFIICVAACSVLAVGSSRVVAHHAFAAEFDAEKPVQLHGVVTQMDWMNPHSWIHVDVKDPDGKVASWEIEGGAPNALLRRGFNKTSLKAGTEIIVDGYQAKDGSNKANGRELIFAATGKRLFLGSPGTGAPDGKDPKQP
jgi:hypothetical protein